MDARLFRCHPPGCGQQETHMNRSLVIVALIAGLGLAACNTVAGAGKDVSSVGKATTKAANDVKK